MGMSDVDETSDSTAASSAMAAVQAAISSLGHFAPKSDATRIAALKEEAEKLRKLRKENRRLQRNEKRKRSRLLAKGSGWDSSDILECFRLKHENALKRQKNMVQLTMLTRTRKPLLATKLQRGLKKR